MKIRLVHLEIPMNLDKNLFRIVPAARKTRLGFWWPARKSRKMYTSDRASKNTYQVFGAPERGDTYYLR